MSNYAEQITREFPLRHKAKEKERFRSWLVGELRRLGYEAKLQSRDSLLSYGGSVTNVVVGDPDKARLILVAHYDTALHEPLPPMISPTRPVSYVLYQALTPVLTLLGSFVLSFAVTFALNLPRATLPMFLLLMVAALAYLRFGPSETRNACDNTSGVAALLETAAALTPRYRGQVAFAFLDCGMSGARSLRSAYPCTREKTVINVSCVARGDELLILPSKYSRWNGEVIDAISASFENTEQKTCFIKTEGLNYFPGENRAFRYSFSLCACEQITGFGRCILPGRAGKDGIDAENLRLVQEGLCKLVAAFSV